jgi:hypothetical protein
VQRRQGVPRGIKNIVKDSEHDEDVGTRKRGRESRRSPVPGTARVIIVNFRSSFGTY